MMNPYTVHHMGHPIAGFPTRDDALAFIEFQVTNHQHGWVDRGDFEILDESDQVSK